MNNGNPQQIIVAQQERIAALELENKLLREKVDLLVRKVFGRSKEDFDANQLELPNGIPVGKVPPPPTRGQAKRGAVPLL